MTIRTGSRKTRKKQNNNVNAPSGPLVSTPHSCNSCWPEWFATETNQPIPKPTTIQRKAFLFNEHFICDILVVDV